MGAAGGANRRDSAAARPRHGGRHPGLEPSAWTALPPRNTGAKALLTPVSARGTGRRCTTRVPAPAGLSSQIHRAPLDRVSPRAPARARAPPTDRVGPRRRLAPVDPEVPLARAVPAQAAPSAPARGSPVGEVGEVGQQRPDALGWRRDLGLGAQLAISRTAHGPAVSQSQPCRARWTSGWLSRSKWSARPTWSTSAPGRLPRRHGSRPYADGTREQVADDMADRMPGARRQRRRDRSVPGVRQRRRPRPDPPPGRAHPASAGPGSGRRPRSRDPSGPRLPWPDATGDGRSQVRRPQRHHVGDEVGPARLDGVGDRPGPRG